MGNLWLISRSQETREMDSIIHDRVQFIAGFPNDEDDSQVSVETISFMLPEIFDRNG